MAHKRRVKKTVKGRLSRYTAYIPKTIKATKQMKNYTVKKTKIFVRSVKNTLKNISKNIDKKSSKMISSLRKNV